MLDAAISPTAAKNLSSYIAQTRLEARIDTLLQIWSAIPAMEASENFAGALRMMILSSEAGEVIKFDRKN